MGTHDDDENMIPFQIKKKRESNIVGNEMITGWGDNDEDIRVVPKLNIKIAT